MTIPQLEAYFLNMVIPEQVQINRGVKCTDTKGFIANHLYVLNKNGLTLATQPFYNRLMELKEYFDKQ